MMTNEITAGPGASVPGNHQQDDSSFYLACNKLFQLTNHQTAFSVQNAEFPNLILKNLLCDRSARIISHQEFQNWYSTKR